MNRNRHSYIGNQHAIREVWQNNVEEEFKVIGNVARAYRYVAMDTEYPGLVVKSEFKDPRSLFDYQCLKKNVDLLSIIQLGLTFYDENGMQPQPVSTWQFNFRFDLDKEPHYPQSIDLLKTSGIDFERLRTEGIDSKMFAELLMVSGVVLMDDVTWITFHSSFDFSYMLKLLTAQAMPADENEYYEVLGLYFKRIYDIKYLMTPCGYHYGGLKHMAQVMDVEMVGQHHQAGNDSRVTGDVFFGMKVKHFNDRIANIPNEGRVFGVRKLSE